MSEKYKETDHMGDIICDDYRILQVISRFGLTLGFGDHTVAETCMEAGVDAPTFLAVVNFIRSNGRATNLSDIVDTVSLTALMKYLRRSHDYFVKFRLPAIRRKLIEAIDCSARNQIAFLILKFYDEFAAEVGRHMDYEDKHIHTYVNDLLAGVRTSPDVNIHKLSHQHRDNHAQIEKSLSELKSIIIKYYPNDSNAQLLNDVLIDLFMTEEDLFSHCHLEDTLFLEAVVRLEEERAEKSEADGVSPEEPETDASVTDSLSEREKEVIICVVKGMSNKEIAEQLFISVNTVMTHRRNISRKLQIHSPAGLTIYAIVNGLINLEDVKL
ncbi:MAG: helix-turn-helix transcriptional regulator [Paraprevotella sp.]|nr:helix-turn-helix transcriptional regulator [Paraprevotella sp.]